MYRLRFKILKNARGNVRRIIILSNWPLKKHFVGYKQVGEGEDVHS